MGQFGEEPVKKPQSRNEPGICKEHAYTKGWCGLNIKDPIGE